MKDSSPHKMSYIWSVWKTKNTEGIDELNFSDSVSDITEKYILDWNKFKDENLVGFIPEELIVTHPYVKKLLETIYGSSEEASDEASDLDKLLSAIAELKKLILISEREKHKNKCSLKDYGNGTNICKQKEKTMSRFDYVKYDEQASITQGIFKQKVSNLEGLIETQLESPRAKALAITKLEECYMWIGKAIRDDQIIRNGSAELQEERSDS